MSEVVLTEVDGPVAVVTIDRPEARNAVNEAVASGMAAALDDLDARADIRVIVLTGAGGTFCSGADRGHLADVGHDPAEDRRYAALSGIYRAFTRVGQLEMPVIAAVCGAAVGAGINLMLAADLRIVADRTQRPEEDA